jgi:hypothetical protein
MSPGTYARHMSPALKIMTNEEREQLLNEGWSTFHLNTIEEAQARAACATFCCEVLYVCNS